MPARIGNIAIDCDDVLKMAAFWSAVLGRPVDQGSSELYASIGGADGTRQEPAWYFNKVPDGTVNLARTGDLGLTSGNVPLTVPSRAHYGYTVGTEGASRALEYGSGRSGPQKEEPVPSLESWFPRATYTPRTATP